MTDVKLLPYAVNLIIIIITFEYAAEVIDHTLELYTNEYWICVVQ